LRNFRLLSGMVGAICPVLLRGVDARLQETRMAKAIYSWKPISKRPTGRPKIRWEDDVKKDTQRLKVPNWKTFVQDRRCKEVVEKAKTLH